MRGRSGRKSRNCRPEMAAGEDEMRLRSGMRTIGAGNDIVHARSGGRERAAGGEDRRRRRTGPFPRDDVSPADDKERQRGRAQGQRPGPVPGPWDPEGAAGQGRGFRGEAGAHARPERVPVSGRRILQRTGTEERGKPFQRLPLPPAGGTGSEVRVESASRSGRKKARGFLINDCACPATVHSHFRRLIWDLKFEI